MVLSRMVGFSVVSTVVPPEKQKGKTEENEKEEAMVNTIQQRNTH